MSSSEDVSAAVAAVPLMRGLPPKHLRQLVERGKVVQHDSGHEVTEEGGRAVGFHLILEGSAQVAVRGAVRRELGPGEYFGEISLLDGKPRTATVTAGDELLTWSLTAWDFNSVLDEEPSLARPMLAVLAGRLREAEARDV